MPDFKGAGEALAGYGQDSRTWAVEATVDEVYLDETGVFVDVTATTGGQPGGLPLRAKLFSTFGGKGRAVHVPIQVGDQVLVVIPNGNPDGAPKAFGPLHTDGDEVPQEVLDDPDSLWIRAADGESVKVKTSGGGNIEITCNGTASVKCDDVLLGNDADQRVALEPPLRTFLSDLLLSLNAATAGGNPLAFPVALPDIPDDLGASKVKAK